MFRIVDRFVLSVIMERSINKKKKQYNLIINVNVLIQILSVISVATFLNGGWTKVVGNEKIIG